MILEEKKERNYSIELLRVIAMFGIVLLHVQTKTGWLAQQSIGQSGWIGSWGIHAWCISSVNVYVLISGYFMPSSRRSVKKVFFLWGSAVTWGVSIFIFNYFIVRDGVSMRNLLNALIPISSRQYWFLTVYVGLYLLSPYLDMLLNKLSKKQYQGMILISITLFSILPTFIPLAGEDGTVGINGIGGTNIIWFIVLYAISGYIRRYIDAQAIRKYRYLLLTMNLTGTLAMLFFQLAMEICQKTFGFGQSYGTWFFNYASIFNLIASIGVFGFFLSFDLKIKNIGIKKLLMFLARGTFAVYLIHENALMRPLLWEFVRVINKSYLMGINYTIKILLIAVCVFAVCCVLEYVRKIAVNEVHLKWDLKIFRIIDNTIYPNENGTWGG